jgi:hypothetical protein
VAKREKESEQGLKGLKGRREEEVMMEREWCSLPWGRGS